MKKNLICVLLAIVLVLGLFVAAPMAFATEESTPATHTDHCICGGISNGVGTSSYKHTCSETHPVWQPWPEDNAWESGNYYYLTKRTTITSRISLGSEQSLTICLNGFDLIGPDNDYAFYLKGASSKIATLNLCDCSAERNEDGEYVFDGNVISNSNKIQNGRIFNIQAYGQFNIYGGNLKAGEDATAITNGGIGCVGSTTSYFYMYNGHIYGSSVTGKGGSIIFINAKDARFFGGVIEGGHSDSTGGNIHIQSSAAAAIYFSGSTIKNGTAGANGGNIYITSTTTTANFNGTVQILDGSANLGGNIYIDNQKSIAMNSATAYIKGGNATYRGGNIYVGASGKPVISVLNIEDGIAAEGGNIYVTGAATLQGTTLKNGQATSGGNIYCAGTCNIKTHSSGVTPLIDGGQASAGGNIFTTGTLNIESGTITGGTATATAGNIRVDGTGSKLNMTGGVVSGGKAETNGGNIFVYNCTNASITGGQILNGESGGAQGGGNLYVTHDLNEEGKIVATRRLTLENVVIRGGKATANGGNIYANRVGILNMTDVTLENGSAVSGDNLYLQNNLEVSITGGSFTATYGGRTFPTTSNKYSEEELALIAQYGFNYPGADAEETGNGGNICIYSCGNITATDETTGETTVTTAGYVNITGSQIIGGNAENGGAIYLGSGTLTLDGITGKTCGGDSGKVLHIAKNGSATVKDSTLVNWGIQGTTIVNSGNLTLLGNISMPKEYNASEMITDSRSTTQEILIKCSENANAVMDISGLTSVDNDVTNEEGIVYGDGVLRVGRSQNTNKDGDVLNTAGLVANGVNDTNRALFIAHNTGFVLAEREASFYLDDAAIQGITENGNISCGGADLNEITENYKDTVVYFLVKEDIANAGTLGIEAHLNLNGKHVSGATVAEGVTLYLMDTANDSYDATKCGSFGGTVAGTLASIVHKSLHWNKQTQSRHYVILPNEDGSWSAHRYMARISHYSMDPANDALGYKAVFSADAVAQAAITGYGFEMWVNDNAAKTYTKTDSFGENATEKSLTLRLNNIMAAGGGEMTVNANAFITFNVGGEAVKADTSKNSTTMKNVVELAEKAVEADPAAYSETQMAALQSFINKFESSMTGWDIDSIKAWTKPEIAEPVVG